jgi:hypothetical protein
MVTDYFIAAFVAFSAAQRMVSQAAARTVRVGETIASQFNRRVS